MIIGKKIILKGTHLVGSYKVSVQLNPKKLIRCVLPPNSNILGIYSNSITGGASCLASGPE